MNSLEQLRDSFLYNDWANRRLIFALRDAPSKRALELMAHLLITEREYYERLYGKDSTGFDFWPYLTRAECSELSIENSENFNRLLSKFEEEGLDIRASYKTSEGETRLHTFRDILQHILFHSMNHRGQINLVLSSEGYSPVLIDYIIYKGGF